MGILYIKRLSEHARLPERASAAAAGWDLYAATEEPIRIPARKKDQHNIPVLVPTGLAMEPQDISYEIQIRSRSGLAFKHGVTVLNSPGTIDADYRGEVKVLLINHGTKDFWVEPGMRIAQMVVSQLETTFLEQVEELSGTDRGSGGFGSTGE